MPPGRGCSWSPTYSSSDTVAPCVLTASPVASSTGATLARQLLLERSDLSVPAAVENLVGLQSQAPLAHYVALWSRLARFRTRLRPESPSSPVISSLLLSSLRTHAMRATVHLFTRRDALAIRALMQPMLAARFASSPFPKLIPNVDLDAVCREARSLATERPLSRIVTGPSCPRAR